MNPEPQMNEWQTKLRDAAIVEQRRRRASGAEPWDDIATRVDEPPEGFERLPNDRCLFLDDDVVFFPSFDEEPDPRSVSYFAPAALAFLGASVAYFGRSHEWTWLVVVGGLLAALGAFAAWGVWKGGPPPPPDYTQGLYVSPGSLWLHRGPDRELLVTRDEVVALKRKEETGDLDAPGWFALLVETRGATRAMPIVSKVRARTPAMIFLERWAR
jgi:hypothetical protein